MATTMMRVSAGLLAILKANKIKGESDAHCLERLTSKPAPLPALANERPAWADELKQEIVKEVKTAIESAMAR